jgi:UrcA family protein
MSIIRRPSAVLLALAIAAPGVARDVGDLTTQVRVKRVAINTPADAQRMERRLKAGALEACGASSFSLADYRDAVARSGCYAAALGRAQAQLAAAGPESAAPRSGGR